MWLFQTPKQRVQEVALKIIKGLTDRTLVPDPPLVPDGPLEFDEGEALPQESGQAIGVFSTSSVAQGVYLSFITGPPLAGYHRAKKVYRGSMASTGCVVVAGRSRPEAVREPVVQ